MVTRFKDPKATILTLKTPTASRLKVLIEMFNP
jgi:hypothetical protein